MLLTLLFNLRAQLLPVGTGEWLAFLRGLEEGLAEDLDGVYWLARAVLVHDEKHYDAFDVAFSATFQGVELPPKLREELLAWLAEAKELSGRVPPREFESWEKLREEYERLLREQKERHDG